MVKKEGISKSLDIDPLEDDEDTDNSVSGEIIENNSSEIVEYKEKEPVDLDYQYARGNFYHIIEKGNEAFEELLKNAKTSEQARDFEVLANLMRTITDANKNLVEMGEKRSEKKESTPGKVTNNNSLFVGSTAELQKMLKGMKNDDK